MDENVKEIIYELYVRQNMKLREVREILCRQFGNRPGFSIANIERYVRKWEFKKRETVTNCLGDIVGEAVCRVGGSAGGRFIQGEFFHFICRPRFLYGLLFEIECPKLETRIVS